MRKVRKTATVAAKTVTRYSEGAVQPRARKSPAPASGRSSRVTVVTVHPAVLAKALELADGDPSRLKIISATEVVVR
jgi:hypothetical protein